MPSLLFVFLSALGAIERSGLETVNWLFSPTRADSSDSGTR